jgi:hypothetical protein
MAAICSSLKYYFDTLDTKQILCVICEIFDGVPSAFLLHTIAKDTAIPERDSVCSPDLTPIRIIFVPMMISRVAFSSGQSCCISGGKAPPSLDRVSRLAFVPYQACRCGTGQVAYCPEGIGAMPTIHRRRSGTPAAEAESLPDAALSVFPITTSVLPIAVFCVCVAVIGTFAWLLWQPQC